MNSEIRNNWTKKEIGEIYHTPLLELVYRAADVHKQNFKVGDIQVCTLLSVKTGGCVEDCAYCSQSARYNTEIEVHKLMDVTSVLNAAAEAKDAGSSRFCMGAAWREVRDNKDFDKILGMIRGVSSMGLEVCCTLGMITEEQAIKMKEAGLHAYNHNLDTSPEFYEQIISTRTYQDRLKTLENVRKAGITVCCGGIVGLGESDDDRISLLETLATLAPHPESVPINALVAIEGTPLERKENIDIWTMVRMIATARILMPASRVRLSAGRNEMIDEQQTLCFLAGANSIFAGDKLLTTPNNDISRDEALFQKLGVQTQVKYHHEFSVTV